MPLYIQILLALAPYLMPIVVAVVTILVKDSISKMPANVQPIVSNIVHTSVAGVEQMAADELNGPGKKQLAMELIDKQLSHWNIHVPPAMISTMIEDAVLGLNIVKQANAKPEAASTVVVPTSVVEGSK